MNIFAKLITYDKKGKCENPVALKGKQERERLSNRVKTEGKLKVSKFVCTGGSRTIVYDRQ